MRQYRTKWQEKNLAPARKKRFLLFSGIIFFLSLGLIFLLSCSPKQNASGASAINGYVYQMFNSFNPRSFLENMGRNVIPPLYLDLAAQADALKTDSDDLCVGTSLATFQNTWKANIAALKKVEMFRFGPALSVYAKVDSFPIVYLEETAPVAEDLDIFDQFFGNSGQAAVFVDPSSGNLPKDAKGIVGIEYLAFSKADPSRGTNPDCGTDLTSNSNSRLNLLRALVDQYRVNIHAMADPWDTGSTSPFGEQLATAGNGSTSFPSAASALDTLFAGAVQLLTAMKDGKLEIPAGLSGGGTGASPDSERPESRFSGNSFKNLQDNLTVFKAVYTGNGTGAGLSDYVKFYSPTLDSEMTAEIANLETILAAAALQGDWGPTNLPNIKAAVNDLGELLTILNTELAALVGTVPVSGGPGGDGD